MNLDEEIREIIVENIEREAKKELGKPYLWGATGNRNFDCSSFVQYVDGKFKIGLPRVARDQFENGKLVTKVYDEKVLKKRPDLLGKNFAGAKRDVDFKKANQIFYEKNKKNIDELKALGNSMLKTTNQLVSKNKAGEKIAQNNKKSKPSVSKQKPKPKLDLGKMVENFFKPKPKKNKEKSKGR